jgi:predicted flap endonuclease-1-like 5' DNA nuclease
MDSVLMMPGQEFKELVQDLKEAVTALHNKTTGSDKDFVGNEELMELMGISKRTAQTWRDQGIIAFSQIGSKIWYSRADIAELMKDHRCARYCESDKKKGGKQCI